MCRYQILVALHYMAEVSVDIRLFCAFIRGFWFVGFLCPGNGVAEWPVVIFPVTWCPAVHRKHGRHGTWWWNYLRSFSSTLILCAEKLSTTVLLRWFKMPDYNVCFLLRLSYQLIVNSLDCLVQDCVSWSYHSLSLNHRFDWLMKSRRCQTWRCRVWC